MILSFTLSMPNIGSWNGQWTGAKNLYVIVMNLPKKKAQKILDTNYYHYNFGDGWSASIRIAHIDSKKAAKLRRATNGFCSYDWMVDSIIANGKI